MPSIGFAVVLQGCDIEERYLQLLDKANMEATSQIFRLYMLILLLQDEYFQLLQAKVC